MVTWTTTNLMTVHA
jgi:hypothetical protein